MCGVVIFLVTRIYEFRRARGAQNTYFVEGQHNTIAIMFFRRGARESFLGKGAHFIVVTFLQQERGNKSKNHLYVNTHIGKGFRHLSLSSIEKWDCGCNTQLLKYEVKERIGFSCSRRGGDACGAWGLAIKLVHAYIIHNDIGLNTRTRRGFGGGDILGIFVPGVFGVGIRLLYFSWASFSLGPPHCRIFIKREWGYGPS